MLQLLRDHPLVFVIAWLLLSILCALLVGRMAAWNEREVKAVYDQDHDWRF